MSKESESLLPWSGENTASYTVNLENSPFDSERGAPLENIDLGKLYFYVPWDIGRFSRALQTGNTSLNYFPCDVSIGDKQKKTEIITQLELLNLYLEGISSKMYVILVIVGQYFALEIVNIGCNPTWLSHNPKPLPLEL